MSLEQDSLNDCPFCGCKAEWHKSYTRGSHLGRDDGYPMWSIGCGNCGISTNTAINSQEKRQILYFWNRRVIGAHQ